VNDKDDNHDDNCSGYPSRSGGAKNPQRIINASTGRETAWL